MLLPLPIDPFVPEIVARLRERRALVVVAAPGAGKTTRVPPALAGDGKVILLQPRRIAARSLARRIAEERGWTIGLEVGWQVRFERRFGDQTRLLVATEGILTARLQQDPLLSEFHTVVLDEFHERSLHADLALALVREARRARPELRLVVMSATLDAQRVSAYLDDCPVIEVPGRLHPVEIRHAPEATPATAIREALGTARGHVLVFLPGAAEIERLRSEIEAAPWRPADTMILPLYGALEAEAQDRALAPTAARKVILATNVAETSITVDGVVEVIDGGLHKVLRFDVESGLDRLRLERIGRDSAEQRAGRAGRTGPGRATRLWDPRLELRPHREPEIERVDLAAPFLEVLAWGADPRAFPWFDPPPAHRAAAALELLERLEATAGGRLTPLGERLHRLPLHPRLGRMLLEAPTRLTAAACAVLAEGFRASGSAATSESDLLTAADRLPSAPASVRAAASELERLIADRPVRPARREPGGSVLRHSAAEEESLLRAALRGYPDRVARRREPGSPRLLLAGGQGATLARESAVRDSEFLVALETHGAARSSAADEMLVRMASAVRREWIPVTRVERVHWLDESGAVRAAERSFHGAIALGERGLAPESAAAADLVSTELLRRPPGEHNEQARRRLRFAGLEIDLPGLLREAAAGRSKLFEWNLLELLPGDISRRLERGAPATLALPSGRQARLDYRDDGSVLAAVKLQELFGLAESPCLGAQREPVTFALLAPERPAGADDARPAQLLGRRLPGGAQGAAGPLSEAPLAGRSLDRPRDSSNDEEAMTESPGRSLTPPILFLLVAVPFGLVFALVFPPFSIADEPSHFMRAWSIAGGRLLPIKEPGRAGDYLPASLPALAHDLAGDLPLNYARKIDPRATIAALRRPLEPERTAWVDFANTASASPLPYLPAAIAIALGRLAGASPLVCFFLGRIANLLAACALLALALRLAPSRRLLWTAIALLPMTICQISGFSADAMLISLGFLWTALVARAAWTERPLVSRDVAVLAAAGAAFCLTKLPYALLCGLLALIPLARFARPRGWRGRAIIASSCAAAMTFSLWCWRRIDLPTREGAAVDPGRQIRELFTEPLHFVMVFGTDALMHAKWYSLQFLGRQLGWLDANVPWIAVGAAGLLLAALAVVESYPAALPTPRQRLVLVLVLLGTWAAIAASQYVTYTPYRQPWIEGLQGRYLLPLAPAGALLLQWRRFAGRDLSRYAWHLAAVEAAILTLALGGVIARYY